MIRPNVIVLVSHDTGRHISLYRERVISQLHISEECS